MSSALIPRLHPLIERLQNPRIHRRDHIDGSVQFFLRHPRFPCVRKAPIHSRIAQPHHRDSEPHKHLLALAQTLDGVGVAIESSKICFVGCHRLVPSGINSLVSPNSPTILVRRHPRSLAAGHPFTALACIADRRQRSGDPCRTSSVQRWQHQDRTRRCD